MRTPIASAGDFHIFPEAHIVQPLHELGQIIDGLFAQAQLGQGFLCVGFQIGLVIVNKFRLRFCRYSRNSVYFVECAVRIRHHFFADLAAQSNLLLIVFSLAGLGIGSGIDVQFSRSVKAIQEPTLIISFH